MTPRRLIEPARLAGSALLHTQSDERLVDLARAGNDRAFEAIVARYRRPLLRHCRRLLPAERAEDAVQQTFLNAYRAIGSGEAELNLRPWLYRIAHNASLSLLRQNGWSHEELDDQFDGVQQPPQAVEERERMRDLVRAVQALPERQREAVVLRELEGRSYEEIALALGVSGGAVRQLLNRARTTLRSAATAVTPFELASWVAARGPGAAPAGERITEICTGAGLGGLAGAAKLGTALVVVGAVAGGTTGAGPLPGVIGGESGRGPDQAVAAEREGAPSAEPRDEGPSSALTGGSGPGEREERRGDDRRGGGDHRDRSGREGEGDDDEDRSGSSGSGSGDGDDSGDDRSGSSGSGSGDDRSGSSGSGSGRSGSGSSGSGSGSSGSGSGSSGSGSGSSGSDDSGGSGSSGSSGSGSSGSSGSGSSGSGSGDSDLAD